MRYAVKYETKHLQYAVKYKLRISSQTNIYRLISIRMNEQRSAQYV